jgi:hypothetical protein
MLKIDFNIIIKLIYNIIIIMVRKRNAAHIEGEPKSIYCCMPCIGCFIVGEKLLQSLFLGTLWVLSCGRGSLFKKRKKIVIPRTTNEEALYAISQQREMSLEIESIEDEEMKDGCI